MDFIQDILNAFLPEFTLIIFIMMNIILSMFLDKNRYIFGKCLCILGFIFTLGNIASSQIEPVYYGFNDCMVSNAFTIFFKILILISAIFITLLSRNFILEIRNKIFHYYSLLMIATLSAMIMVSANDFVTLFISMEMLNISSCFLIMFKRGYESKKQALKYIITSSLATSIFLFGVSYLYGLTGQLNFSLIPNNLNFDKQTNAIFNLSCISIVCGLTFKFACVPFVNWVSDVYEKSSYPVCAFLSIIPKLSTFAILSKILIFIFPSSNISSYLILLISILTIAYGSLNAMFEKNMKRFMAFSTILHCGFILLGLATLSVYGLSSSIYYLIVYIFMATGVWAALILFNGKKKLNLISDYKGIIYQRPFYTVALSFCFIALMGLPPTGGFLAKFYILSSLVKDNKLIFIVSLFAILILMILGIYFYTNVIKILYEKTKPLNWYNKATAPKTLLYISTIVILALCFYSERIIELCQLIAYEL